MNIIISVFRYIFAYNNEENNAILCRIPIKSIETIFNADITLYYNNKNE